MEKRRLHVKESSEVVIAVTESRKVFCPEDLMEKHGFKLSDFYTYQPCLVPNCKDPACVYGHTCKSPLHRELRYVLEGLCFSVFLKSGYVQKPAC